MSHRYVWVLTRDDGIHIDDVLAHCGSEYNENHCCLCRANGACEEHPEERNAPEDVYFPGCAIHLMWDYAVVGGRWYDEMTTARGKQPFTVPGTFIIAENEELTNCIRLSDMDIDSMRCVPFDIVNGAVDSERDIGELRAHTGDSMYQSDGHRKQVMDYLATIPNPDEVTVWGVDAHS